MNVDLNKPFFAKLVFSTKSNDCEDCALKSSFPCLPCSAGHWEIDEILTQSDITFDMQPIQDSNNSVDSKMQQIKEETKQETEYFY